ncbi:NnrU family protein [Croceicoccus sp. YJ47]|uniref:NnrU family protein n=1 Tax=Croceicoccus sp. YJ47 TaxID=2798724 RepID=UPI0035303A94
MTDISLLLSAAIVFVGTHILLSGPLRPLVAGWLGERGFAIAYSLIALVTLGWMVRAFRHAPAAPMLWDGWHIASWLAGSVLTLLALVFLLGSVVRNPALPHPEAEAVAQAREATGIFAVTRHPMMWGIALWAAAHIVVAPNPRTLVLAGALGFLALAGSRASGRAQGAPHGQDMGGMAGAHDLLAPAIAAGFGALAVLGGGGGALARHYSGARAGRRDSRRALALVVRRP